MRKSGSRTILQALSCGLAEVLQARQTTQLPRSVVVWWIDSVPPAGGAFGTQISLPQHLRHGTPTASASTAEFVHQGWRRHSGCKRTLTTHADDLDRLIKQAMEANRLRRATLAATLFSRESRLANFGGILGI